jgi:hypothetical protein
VLGIGERQGWHVEHLLKAQMKRLPAGDEQRDSGGSRQQLSQPGGSREDVLDVVQDEEQLALCQVRLEALEQKGALQILEPELLPNRREDSIGIADRGQIDEDDPVSEVGADLAADLEDQTGLADTTWTSKGEQPDLIG